MKVSRKAPARSAKQDSSPSVGPAASAPSRKRPTKEEQRAAAAERQRRARERRKAKTDPDGYAEEKAAKALAEVEAASKAQAESVAAAAAAANLEKQLTHAIAGTVEAIAEGVQMFALDQDGPHIGNDRSRTIAELWAPILAPYVDAAGMKHLPLILAGTGTAGALLQWSGEYREYRTGRPAKPVVRPPTPPAPVVAEAPVPEFVFAEAVNAA